MDGRRPHHRRAAAAHTSDGRPPRTPPTGGRGPHKLRAAAAPHQRRPAAARKRARATRFDPCGALAAAQRLPSRQPRPQKKRPGCRGEERRGQGGGKTGWEGIIHSSHTARKKARARENTRQRHHHVPAAVGVRATARKARAKKVRARQRAASQTSAVAQVSRNRPPEALAPRRGSRTPLRTSKTTSERAWARCTTAATPHTPSGTPSRGWPARGRTQSWAAVACHHVAVRCLWRTRSEREECWRARAEGGGR